MNPEIKGPARPGGAVIKFRCGSRIEYMPAGGRFPGSERAPKSCLDFVRSTWPDSLPAERRHHTLRAWRAADARLCKLPGGRILTIEGARVHVFPVATITGAPRNLVAWLGDRAEFVFAPMRPGDTIRIGRAYRGLVIADVLADGLTIHAATGAGVLVGFGLFNLATIGAHRIRKRWRGRIAYAPAGGFRPTSAVGFSEPAAMARALGADFLIPAEARSWVSLANSCGLHGVRRAVEAGRLPFGDRGKS